MNPTCCVCLEDIPYFVDGRNRFKPFCATLTLCCGNVMHYACCEAALDQGNGCPLCRSHILDEDDETLLTHLRQQAKQKQALATWTIGKMYFDGFHNLQQNARLGFEFQYRGLCLEHDHTSSRFFQMLAESQTMIAEWSSTHQQNIILHDCGVKDRTVELCSLILECQRRIDHA